MCKDPYLLMDRTQWMLVMLSQFLSVIEWTVLISTGMVSTISSTTVKTKSLYSMRSSACTCLSACADSGDQQDCASSNCCVNLYQNGHSKPISHAYTYTVHLQNCKCCL